MTNDKQRERLVELIIASVNGCARNWAEVIADYLLANGVIVPPCKVGEIVYWLTPYGIEELTVDLIKIIGNQEISIRTRRFVKEIVYFSLEHFGKTVFLTKEEAEAKLKGVKK